MLSNDLNVNKQKSLSPAERDSQDIELLRLANKALKEKLAKQATAIDRLILQKKMTSSQAIDPLTLADSADPQRGRSNPFGGSGGQEDNMRRQLRARDLEYEELFQKYNRIREEAVSG